MQIKTVTGQLSQPEQFDNHVNRWLTEGWQLDGIPSIREGYLIAGLKKESPAAGTAGGSNK